MDHRVIRILGNAEAASRAAAAAVAVLANDAIGDRGVFHVALAGGRTPRRMYEILATEHGEAVPWDQVEVLWGDERCVPPDDPRSNYAMARSTLLDGLPVHPRAVHRIRGELGPDRAASEYDRLVAGIETLDLAILGAGADGHTASLFPGQLEPDDDRWARGVHAPPGVEPRERVTLTLRALNAFSHVLFLVTGRGKRGVVSALEKARRAGVGAEAPPAVRVRGINEPLWVVDTEAAGW